MLQAIQTTTAPADKANLAPFVRSDLSFDISAIKALAKARYALKLDFINSYTGEPRRFWQRLQARQAIRDAWREASSQRHKIVWARLPRELPYTADELARCDVLRARMASSPISMQGNVAYNAAAGEYGAISLRAQRRAYDAILKAARAA